MKHHRVLLVIPTHCRPRKLSRTLGFIDQQRRSGRFDHNVRIDIHLLDSSYGDHRQQNLERVSSFEWPSEVNHYDYSGLSFHQKYSRFVSGLTDELVCTIGDDDFVSLHGLTDACNFLFANSDYSSANGLILKGSPTAEEHNWSVYPQRGSSLNSACERIRQHLSDNTNNFYSVVRGPCLAAYWPHIGTAPIGQSLKERSAAIAPLLCGKRKILTSTFLIRDKSGSSGYDESGRRTLDTDPDSRDYVNELSYGYAQYEERVLGWLSDKDASADCIDAVKGLLRRDFEDWRHGKVKSQRRKHLPRPLQKGIGLINRCRTQSVGEKSYPPVDMQFIGTVESYVVR